MPPTTAVRPGRPLIALALLLAVVFGTIAALGTWAPRLGLDLQGGTSITLTATTVDGSDPTQESLDEAVAIIRQRVNGSGVAEAEVTTQGTDTIIVQVPGVGQDELVELVGQTAELTFRPVLAIVPGSAPVTDGFFVDLYINPRSVPQTVNQTWDQLGDHGVVWGVTGQALAALVQGGSITLAAGDLYYIESLSIVPGSMQDGTIH